MLFALVAIATLAGLVFWLLRGGEPSSPERLGAWYAFAGNGGLTKLVPAAARTTEGFAAAALGSRAFSWRALGIWIAFAAPLLALNWLQSALQQRTMLDEFRDNPIGSTLAWITAAATAFAAFALFRLLLQSAARSATWSSGFWFFAGAFALCYVAVGFVHEMFGRAMFVLDWPIWALAPGSATFQADEIIPVVVATFGPLLFAAVFAASAIVAWTRPLTQRALTAIVSGVHPAQRA